MLARHTALAVVVILVAGWAFFLRPPELGGTATYVVVRGGSMQPAHKGGDLVIVRASPGYRVGDIAAYRVPQGEVGAGHLVIHRITGGDPAGGFVFKGDNNPTVDPWRPKQADLVGREWAHLPGWGSAVVFVRQPLVIAALAAAIVVAAILARPPRRTRAEGAPSPQRAY